MLPNSGKKNSTRRNGRISTTPKSVTDRRGQDTERYELNLTVFGSSAPVCSQQRKTLTPDQKASKSGGLRKKDSRRRDTNFPVEKIIFLAERLKVTQERDENIAHVTSLKETFAGNFSGKEIPIRDDVYATKSFFLSAEFLKDQRKGEEMEEKERMSSPCFNFPLDLRSLSSMSFENERSDDSEGTRSERHEEFFGCSDEYPFPVCCQSDTSGSCTPYSDGGGMTVSEGPKFENGLFLSGPKADKIKSNYNSDRINTKGEQIFRTVENGSCDNGERLTGRNKDVLDCNGSNPNTHLFDNKIYNGNKVKREEIKSQIEGSKGRSEGEKFESFGKRLGNGEPRNKFYRNLEQKLAFDGGKSNSNSQSFENICRIENKSVEGEKKDEIGSNRTTFEEQKIKSYGDVWREMRANEPNDKRQDSQLNGTYGSESKKEKKKNKSATTISSSNVERGPLLDSEKDKTTAGRRKDAYERKQRNDLIYSYVNSANSQSDLNKYFRPCSTCRQISCDCEFEKSEKRSGRGVRGPPTSTYHGEVDNRGKEHKAVETDAAVTRFECCDWDRFRPVCVFADRHPTCATCSEPPTRTPQGTGSACCSADCPRDDAFEPDCLDGSTTSDQEVEAGSRQFLAYASSLASAARSARELANDLESILSTFKCESNENTF